MNKPVCGNPECKRKDGSPTSEGYVKIDGSFQCRKCGTITPAK